MKKGRKKLILLASLLPLLSGCFIPDLNNISGGGSGDGGGEGGGEQTPCEANGHNGKHYFAHNMPSLVSTQSEGTKEYWECDVCNEHYFDVKNINGTWTDAVTYPEYSSFLSTDDRLLPLPTFVLDNKDNVDVILDANDMGIVKSNSLVTNTINSNKPVYDNEYGGCVSFKFTVTDEKFEFLTKEFSSTLDQTYGEVFAYINNSLGYASKISVLAGEEAIIDNISFSTGWNKITFSDVSKISGKELKFIVKSYTKGDYKIKLSSFYGAQTKQLTFDKQYVDLNISENGSVDENKKVKLDMIDNPNVTSITSIKYNGVQISTNEYIKTKTFNLKTGEETLRVTYTSGGLSYETDYKIFLCTKIITTKEELNSFPQIASSLGDSNILKSDGYFLLGNDIDYNDIWASPVHRNSFSSNWGLQFNVNSGFCGTFDGNGHVIKNMVISHSKTGDYNGNSFIYKLGEKGVIKNLGFIGASLAGSGGYVTSIGEGTISNVYVEYKNSNNATDGLGTFFYYDRSNDLGTLDKSYVDSKPLRVINSFVNASQIADTNSNVHAVGSKMYGKVELDNVFGVAKSSIIDNAVVTDKASAGAYLATSLDELSKSKVVTDAINNNFTSSLFERDDIAVPKELKNADVIDGFIKNGKTNYSIYLSENDSVVNESVSFLVEYIKKATGANIYVSKNEVEGTLPNESIFFNKGSGNKNDYSIKIENGKVTLTYNSTKQIKNLVLTFLKEVFGYRNYNFDLEICPHLANVTLTNLNKSCSSATDSVLNYGYYDEDKLYQSGYGKIADQLISVRDSSGTNFGQYHNQFAFLSPEEHYSSHPKWFTPDMESYGGYFNKKSGASWSYSNLCFNAQGDNTELALMKNEFYKNLKRNLLANPDIDKICIGLGDNDRVRGEVYCGCNKCLQEENPSISIIRFLNDMSSRIKQDADFAGRNIILYTMAYRAAELAPDVSQVKCDENVGVWIAPISANYSAALNDDSVNSLDHQNIEKWKLQTNHIGFYLYDTNYTRVLAPFYNFETMLQNNKYLKSLGAEFVYYCDETHNKASTGFGAFKNYILRESSINANVTYEELYNDFFSETGYYGKAGPRLKYYFGELCKAINIIGKDKFGDVYNSHVFNSKQLGAHCGSMSYWKSYSIDEAYDLLDTTDPNYEIHKKHILTESITLRITKYLATGSWFDGDSESKFISDCNSVGITYIQEGIELTSSSIASHKNNL